MLRSSPTATNNKETIIGQQLVDIDERIVDIKNDDVSKKVNSNDHAQITIVGSFILVDHTSVRILADTLAYLSYDISSKVRFL